MVGLETQNSMKLLALEGAYQEAVVVHTIEGTCEDPGTLFVACRCRSAYIHTLSRSYDSLRLLVV